MEATAVTINTAHQWPPNPIRKLALVDLLPSGEDLMDIAYSSLAGDPAAPRVGRHAGRNPHRRDNQGLTKTFVHKRAMERDLSWFVEQAHRLHDHPFDLPPSLRTYIPKQEENPAAGKRPVDDPAEVKRPVALHVRRIVEPRVEPLLHPGQRGGRSPRYVEPICQRKGATAQDHLATGIHDTIYDGYPVALVADLKDAFGLIPRSYTIKLFQSLGFTQEAARWLWRLVRIDAIDSRTRSHHFRRAGRGIEQGGALSSMICNLVLAPILRAVEHHLDVRAFTYLDDITFMARSVRAATDAFHEFRRQAKARGFTNVRRLRTPGDPAHSKNSTIIDTRVEPVAVIKTYLVDSLGISLHPTKVKELQEGRTGVDRGVAGSQPWRGRLPVTARAHGVVVAE